MNFQLQRLNKSMFYRRNIVRLVTTFFLFFLVIPSNAQDCTENDDIEQLTSNSFFNFNSGQGVGQSFTALCTGRLRAIEVEMFSVDESPIVGTLRIFEGDAASGAEIAVASYSIDETGGRQRTALQSFVPIQAGEVYTFFFDAPASGVGNISGFNGNPYTGGLAYAGPDAGNLSPFGTDLNFTADLAPVECTNADAIEQLASNAFFNFIPTQGVGQSFTAPCTGRLRSLNIDMFSVDESPIVGTLRIFEGGAASGAEIAVASYSINETGSQLTALQSFVPIEAGQVYTFFFDTPASGMGNISGFNGNPYAGGIAYAGPDASNLTPFGTDLGFSADLAPVECTDIDGIDQLANNAFFNFIPAQGVGQSFTAPCTGELRSVTPGLSSVDESPIVGVLQIFEGDAASGNEVARASYSFDATGLAKAIVLPFPVAVDGGSQYTFFFDAPTSGTGNISGFNGNPYAGGSAYAGSDASSLNQFGTDVTFGADLGPRVNVSEAATYLSRLYFSTNGDQWSNNDNWLVGDLTTWHGVTLTNGEVTEINLLGNGLTGQIPAELGGLSMLSDIELSQNALEGSLPPELGNLTNVTFFSVFDNQLSGSIPAEFGDLNSLDHLQLGRNQFTGDLPSELGNLTALTALLAEDNNFAGGVPSSFGGLTSINSLDLSGNRQMNGTLPFELTQLTNMTFLDVSNTGLCDNLDPAFQSWAGTVTTVISAGCTNVANEDFSGVPTEFALKDNYPNPFNPATTISFDVPETMAIQLQIFDIQGRLIETLVNESLAPGRYERQWKAQNVASGMYMYRLTAGDFVETRPMVLLK
ncbi:MAG: T9SS type A sorting domain-containing protein [Rhodothermales bacterium]